MPEFHRARGYGDPVAANKCPFQLAFKTSKPAFDFMQELPQSSLDAFHTYMAIRTRNSRSWLSVYPFGQEINQSGPDDMVFVDVGGGFGHQCLDLRKRYPNLQGRVILQDLEHPIGGRLEYASVEGMVHDAFKTQPIKGLATFSHTFSVSTAPYQEPSELLWTENLFSLILIFRSSLLLPSCRASRLGRRTLRLHPLQPRKRHGCSLTHLD